MDPYKDIQRPIEEGKRFLGFISESYRDYLAARILFNNNQLIQACSLANTSIEKFLKALINFEGNKTNFKHDSKQLFNNVKEYDLNLYNKLNIDFLDVLTKIYASRYIGDCNTGYNMVILKNKFLAELDYTYSVLEPKFRLLEPGTSQVLNSRYEIDLLRQNPALISNNYILLGIDKTIFIEKMDYVFELRIHNHHVIEATYSTNESKNDNLFTVKALEPEGIENKSFKTYYRAYTVDNINDLSIIINGRFLKGKNI